MTSDRRTWLAAMIARVEPRAVARRRETGGGAATIAAVFDSFVDDWRRELAGEPRPAPLPPLPIPARQEPSAAPPTQLSMFEIPA